MKSLPLLVVPLSWAAKDKISALSNDNDDDKQYVNVTSTMMRTILI